MKIYNRTNFFKHTYCNFIQVTETELPKKDPDYISKSKSCYYFTDKGVYRVSNHWGRAANCRWKLIANSYQSQKIIVAYANWSDFFPNNESEKLFFIRVDYLNDQVSFHHKQEKIYKQTDILRNGVDTAKRIKLIQQIFLNDSWCKYIQYTDYDALKTQMLNQLLNTNKSLADIKRELNGKT